MSQLFRDSLLRIVIHVLLMTTLTQQRVLNTNITCSDLYSNELLSWNGSNVTSLPSKCKDPVPRFMNITCSDGSAPIECSPTTSDCTMMPDPVTIVLRGCQLRGGFTFMSTSTNNYARVILLDNVTVYGRMTLTNVKYVNVSNLTVVGRLSVISSEVSSRGVLRVGSVDEVNTPCMTMTKQSVVNVMGDGTVSVGPCVNVGTSKSAADGGCVSLDSSRLVVMKDMNVSQCDTWYGGGGGVYGMNSVLWIGSALRIWNTTSALNGGGLFLQNTSVVDPSYISTLQVIRCSATRTSTDSFNNGGGGCIYLRTVAFYFDYLYAAQGYTNTVGGCLNINGAFVNVSHTMTLQDCVTPIDAGGFFMNGIVLNVTTLVVVNCSTYNYGGGIHLGKKSILSADFIKISDCRASFGGGMGTEGGNSRVSIIVRGLFQIINSYARLDAGAMKLSATILNATRIEIHNCSSSENTGGASTYGTDIYSKTIHISNCFGGGLYFSKGLLIAESLVVTDCDNTYHGGCLT
eukprot:PhF_6_TR23276/c0_g1_i6/m.32762